MIRTVHTAKYVFPEAGILLRNGAVHISHPGRISRVEPGQTPPPNLETKVIDWGSAIILPGLVNGWLVAYLDVPPFIATFSMLGVCHGVSELVIEGVYATGLPQLAANLGRGHLAYRAAGGRWSFLAPPEVERGTEVLALVPSVVVLAAAVLLLLGFLLARRLLGHLLRGGGPTSHDRLISLRFGAAAVRALSQAGVKVMLCDIEEEALARAVAVSEV